MAVGITAWIEFSTNQFQSLAESRTATPGGVFLWANREVKHWLGLLADDKESSFEGIGQRGIPNHLSRELVTKNGLLISDEAPGTNAEKREQRRFLFDDEAQWRNQGLQILEIEQPEAYNFSVSGNEKLILNPGCERPSWMDGEAIHSLLEKLDSVIAQESVGHSVQYNLTIFRWLQALTQVYGQSGVRLVYWFDSLPTELRN